MSDNLTLQIAAEVIDNATARIRAIRREVQKSTDQLRVNAAAGQKMSEQQKVAFAKAKQASNNAIAANQEVIQSQKRVIQQQKAAQQAFSDWSSRMQNGLLGIGLSILFTGMALKRLTDSALRGIITTMQQVTGDTHEFSVLTNTLSANWEFFKFQLMDALMQSGLFQWFIDKLIGVLNWLQELSPATKRWMVIFLVAGSVIGGAMMIVGQALLFLLAPLALLKLAGITTFAALKAVLWPFLIGLLKVFAVFAIVIVAIVLLRRIFKSEMSIVNKVILAVLVTVLALAGVFAVLGMAAVAVIFLKIAAFVALIAVALAFKEELGIAFGFILAGLIEIGSAIFETLVAPLEATLWAAGKLADILGMEGASRGIGVLSDQIDNVRGGIDKLRQANFGKIDALVEQRKNRDPFMERTGLNALLGQAKEFKNDFSTMPEVPAEDNVFLPGTNGDSSQYFDQKFEFNITQLPGEDSEVFAQRVVEEQSEMINRMVPTTQRG